MKIREITDKEEITTVQEDFCMEKEEIDILGKIFSVETKYEDMPYIYFFQNKDGFYHTVIHKDSIYTESLEEIKVFILNNL